MLHLGAAALLISIIVWGIFGYFMMPYLMGQAIKPTQNSRRSVETFVLAPNMAAAAVAFAFPQLTIIQPINLPNGGVQIPNTMTGNSVTSVMCRIES